MIENRYHVLRRFVNRLHELSPIFHCTKDISLPFKKRRLRKRIAEVRLPASPDENDPLFSAVEIETMNRCNGSCGFCPVNHRQDPRPFKKMTEELFRKIIDELAAMEFRVSRGGGGGEVSLYSNNEPLLDTRIADFAGYAKAALPGSRICLCTNGMLLDVAKYRQLIDNLDFLIIDNYCTDYKLRPNIAEIAAYAEQHPELRSKTSIQIRYENQIMTTRGGQAPNSPHRVKKTLDVGCLRPLRQMIIRPDGKLSLCCNDALGTVTIGDAHADSLARAWNSAAARAARRKVLSSRTGFEICKRCDSM